MTGRSDWLADGLAIGYTTLRRRVRRRRQHPLRLALGLTALAALWAVVVLQYVDLGGPTAAVGTVSPATREVLLGTVEELLAEAFGAGVRDLARAVVTAGWLALVWVSAMSVTTSAADLDVSPAVLQATSVRAVLVGSVVSSNVRRLVRYGTHAVLGTAVFALGDGTVAALPLTVLVVVVLSVSSSLTGYVVGLGIRAWLLGGRRRWRYRHLFGATFGVGPVAVAAAVVLSGDVLPYLPALVAVGSAIPIGWTADLALLTVPGVDASPWLGTAALVGLVASTPALFGATQRLANRVWFADRGPGSVLSAVATTIESRSGARTEGLERLLAPVGDRPTRAIVRRSVRIVLRSPARLYLVGSPLVFAGLEVFDGPASGDPTVVPFVTVGAGALVCVGVVPSPFERAGSTRSALVTAGVDGRQVVRAYVLTTTLLVLPAAVLGALLAGVFTPVAPAVAAGFVVLTLVLVPAGSALAVGFDVAMPGPAPGESGDGETVDTYATAAGVGTVLLVTAPATLVVVLPHALGVTVTLSTAVLCVLLSCVLAAGCGVVAARHAAGAFDALPR